MRTPKEDLLVDDRLWLSYVVNETVVALALVGLVGKTAEGFGGLPGRLLSLRPVQYVGKISYGHLSLPPLCAAGVLEASQHPRLAPARQRASAASDRYANQAPSHTTGGTQKRSGKDRRGHG